MRRTTIVALVTTVLLVLLTAGAVLAATIECPISGVVCEGTIDNDSMQGTASSDEMNALAGDDLLSGREGDDILNGDDGDDVWFEDDGTDTMNGGPGKDELFGENGDDELVGEHGDDRINALEGSSNNTQGVDTASGGPAKDTIAANDGFEDHIDCGPGNRDIAYSDKGLDSVSSDCEWRRSYDTPYYCSAGVPWTGEQSRRDNDYPLWVGNNKILWCIDGTTRDNKLVGTSDLDLVDSIWGHRGDDTLEGRLGADSLEGWKGNDTLVGGPGGDFLYGDSSHNPQDRPPIKGSGEDELFGGDGKDFVGAIDGQKDTISCGRGSDWVQMDKGLDVAKNCEEIEFEGENHLWWFRSMGHRRR